MSTIIEKYIKEFNAISGSNMDKVKTIIMRHADHWEWEGSESVVADILDDENITAEDIVEILTYSVEFEGGNQQFKHAVIALQACLRRSLLGKRQEQMKDSDFTDFSADDWDARYDRYDIAI